jgi:hypothetical protein
MTISLAFLAPNLVKAAVEGRLPAASESSGSAIRRLNGADSLRRSDSIRNNCNIGPRSRTTVAQKSKLWAQVWSDFAHKPGRRERNFWMQRQSAKNHR